MLGMSRGIPQTKAWASHISPLEDEILQSIRGRLGKSEIELFGLRDDAGVVTHAGRGIPGRVSVDSVVEGVPTSTLPSARSSADVGWKALMQVLSDLAAMGAAPLGALIALAVPGDRDEGLVLGVSSDGVAGGIEIRRLPHHRR